MATNLGFGVRSWVRVRVGRVNVYRAMMLAATLTQSVRGLCQPQVSFTVPSAAQKQRLDAFLSSRIDGYSRSFLGNLCDLGKVYVDGEPRQKKYSIKEGERITLTLEEPAQPHVSGEPIPLDVLFEDDHFIAVNKPAGMVVHPALGSPNGTFVNALVHYLQNKSLAPAIDEFNNMGLRPGIVHRLDKGTSGLLIAAKTASALAALSSLFSSRQVTKNYICVTVGNPGTKTVVAPIGRHRVYRQQMDVVPPPRGRPAISHAHALAFDGKLSVVRVGIETGRTHQIRVHMKHINCPILGDAIYGNAEWNRKLQTRHSITRPLLHANTLVFKHPFTQVTHTLTAPIPSDMHEIINRISPKLLVKSASLTSNEGLAVTSFAEVSSWYRELDEAAEAHLSDQTHLLPETYEEMLDLDDGTF